MKFGYFQQPKNKAAIDGIESERKGKDLLIPVRCQKLVQNPRYRTKLNGNIIRPIDKQIIPNIILCYV